MAEVPRGLEVLDLSATSMNDSAVAALLDALAPPTPLVSSPISTTISSLTVGVTRDLGSLDDDELVATKFTDDRKHKGGLDDDDKDIKSPHSSLDSNGDGIPAASLAVLILSDCKELKRPIIQSNTLRYVACAHSFHQITTITIS
jgi:hypothetical protein